MAMRPSLQSLRLAATPLVCGLLLTACATLRPNPTPPYIIPGGPGNSSFTRAGGDESGVIFRIPNNGPRVEAAGPGIAVNAFLWRGALETLGSLPLTSADPFGGVIITDWYSPPNAPSERFKETAMIVGRGLRSDAIRVSVFRQVNQAGRWVDAPVDPAVQTDIQNKVLDRARFLRQQATGQG